MEYHAINTENKVGPSVLTWKDVSFPAPTSLQADGCEAVARWKADNSLCPWENLEDCKITKKED